MNTHKVHLRGGFSDRNKIWQEPTQMQYESLNTRTRVAIINKLDTTMYLAIQMGEEVFQTYYLSVLQDVYAMKATAFRVYSWIEIAPLLHETIETGNYDEVLTVVEHYVRRICDITHTIYDFSSAFNAVFEKEYVGYRFINRIIMKITSNDEIEAIEDATKTPYNVVNNHLLKAQTFLANRENPDYENSIKESISAVEALCAILTDVKGANSSLGKTLDKLESKNIKIHVSLKEGFKKLFGYTSDANGIRHAGDIGGAASTFNEAKFMLVTCSAFINYLIGVSAD